MIEKIKRWPIVAWFLRLIHPCYSTCRICGLPWCACESHSISVVECTDFRAGSGFFPVCDWCWTHRSKEENRSAVIGLYYEWAHDEHGSPYTLKEMLDAFERDWEETHKKQ